MSDVEMAGASSGVANGSHSNDETHEEEHDRKPSTEDTTDAEIDMEFPSDLFEDDDDEIAYTLPVYINQSLTPALNLFQYPLHHKEPQVSEWARSQGQHVTARMKEVADRFELEIPIDMRPSVWDDERAEVLGFAREDPNKKGKGRARDDSWGNVTRLRTEPVPEVTTYWGGMVHDGALHLHPVNRIQQLRPALGYLDAVEAIARAEKEKAVRQANGEEEEDDDDEPEQGKTSKSKAKKEKEAELKTVQLAMAQAPEEAIQVRRGSKMGTGGTVGTTTQIRNKLVKAIAVEAADTWVPWGWDSDKHVSALVACILVDSAESRSDYLLCSSLQSEDVLRSLGRMLLPRRARVPLECETRSLDVISKKNIGEGARLIN
ncbi:hypothetical protein QFC22_002262 [Naganishia vaughanmartiniae]|uniref:Uncharacterized protein n=1 Tax=Naganishia vaughanmartiniae TaxID=1424756 RepID=A0ACC2XCI5_9TREE|nr:hypothetical protein QFC22_002262 [Naganishia vaughanmartiniae]